MVDPTESSQHTADYDAGSAKRDALLDATLRLHDLRYGTGHCDRKYVQVCSRFQELIFEAGRVTPPAKGDAS